MRELDDLMARLARAWPIHALPKKHGLTPTQMFILRHLERSGQTKASDLARVSGLSPGAVTQVCDELVSEELVVRTRSRDDRRVVQHEITDKGRRIMDSIVQERCEMLQMLLRQVDPNDAIAFVRVIGQLVKVLERDNNR